MFDRLRFEYRRTNLTSHHLYLPKFEGLEGFSADVPLAWVERSSGRCFPGGSSPAPIGYRLSETAEFVRPGSMLPMVSNPHTVLT